MQALQGLQAQDEKRCWTVLSLWKEARLLGIQLAVIHGCFGETMDTNLVWIQNYQKYPNVKGTGEGQHYNCATSDVF